jgi:asparagine synthase (glutamine-hydrolysing)
MTMCGINGVVHRGSVAPVDEAVLLAMRDTMTHRGPDDAGHHMTPGAALGSRRLSILDLSPRGRMPMGTPDGRYWITYNGEVYNYRDLRSRLEARGHSFVSNTDTEVILRLYAEEGAAMLPSLNGMFAMAIWDAAEKTLFLARDRLGVKPLYYAEIDGRFYFASEQKALFAAGIPLRFDPGCWEELLCFRYVGGERTLHEGVKRLLPGHHLVWKDGVATIHRWWSLANRAASLRASLPSDPVRWFRETFDSAVGLRRIADVPVGVLLSGGLDSSSIAASLALQAGSGVASFTMRFDEPGYDEGPLAREVAARYRLEYHELTVAPDHLVDNLLEATYINDEPLVHDSDMHLLAISKYAKPRVTVLLSGEGGDETLGGYVRYRPLRHPRLVALARPLLPAVATLLGARGRLRKLSRFLELGPLRSFILYNACDVLPGDLVSLGMAPTGQFAFRQTVLQEAETLYPSEPVRQAMYCDQRTFLCSILDRNDRMTMGASIECRVPFLDYRLVEGLAALPTSVLLAGRQGEPLLRRALHDRLPRSVRRHRKWGFGVPWPRYLRGNPHLRDFVHDLPNLEPVRSGPFERRRLTAVIREFLAGNECRSAIVRQLVMIILWHLACFRR